MGKLIEEIKYDLDFVRAHTLQPKWFKAVKIFILLGFLAGYAWLFGLTRMEIFLGVFLFLMLMVHFTYRIKTRKYTRSWLDFTAPRIQTSPRPSGSGNSITPPSSSTRPLPRQSVSWWGNAREKPPSMLMTGNG